MKRFRPDSVFDPGAPCKRRGIMMPDPNGAYVPFDAAAKAVEVAYREGHEEGYRDGERLGRYSPDGDWNASAAKAALDKLGVGE